VSFQKEEAQAMKGRSATKKQIRAWVLIKTEPGQALKVAGKIGGLGAGGGNVIGVPDVVIGPYDIVVPVEAKSVGALTKVVVSQIQSISGVRDTLTMVVATSHFAAQGIEAGIKGLTPWGG
jgi:DNA-binding Lrp family transcriptional regulator